MASAVLHNVTSHDAATSGGGVSSGEYAGTFSGVPIDLHHLRVVFPDRWSAFVRANFHSTLHVALFFSVDERTARNWWEGVTAPRSEVLLKAVIEIPGALQILTMDLAA